MAKFGYFMASEEHAPNALLEQAALAEAAGFESLWISDHLHPWLDVQGESSFVRGRPHSSCRCPLISPNSPNW